MASEPPANMDGLPAKALSHVATYLPKTERALFAVALTAPSPSWERCGWTDVALSRASRIVMDGPYYGPCASNEYEMEEGERAAAVLKCQTRLVEELLPELKRSMLDIEPDALPSPEQEHQLTESFRIVSAEMKIMHRLLEESLQRPADDEKKEPLRAHMEKVKMEHEQICSFVGTYINVDGAGEYEEKWEVLDFMDVEERVRLQLTDGDVGGVLVCIGALTTLRILRLPHCINVRGDGLSPLRGSAVLEKIDLSLASITDGSPADAKSELSGDLVAPILESIVAGEKHSVNHINLPNVFDAPNCWCNGFGASQVKFLQFVHSHFGAESLPEHHNGCRKCNLDGCFGFEITREGRCVLQTCEECDMRYCEKHEDSISECDGCDKRKCDACCPVWSCNCCRRRLCGECDDRVRCDKGCGNDDLANCTGCASNGNGSTKRCVKCGQSSCSECGVMEYCFSREGHLCVACHREDHDAIECYWQTMPPGLERLVAERATRPITEDALVDFWRECTKLLCSDKEFDAIMLWKYRQGVRSALILATSALLEGQDVQAAWLILYAALMEEVCSYGPNCMTSLFNLTSELPSVIYLGQHFDMIRAIIAWTSTRQSMIDFLRGSQYKMNMREENELYSDMLSMVVPGPIDDQSTPLHSLTIVSEEQCTVRSIILQILDLDTGRQATHHAMENARLSWLLRIYSIGVDLQFQEPGRIRPTICGASTFLRAVHKGRTLFLSSSGKRTIKELGICEGDKIVVGGVESKQDSGSPKAIAKPKGSKKAKKKRRAKQKKKPKPLPAPTLTDEQLTEQYRQQHSQTMTGVFEELEPQLKDIRNQLNALTIQRLPPKVRKPKAKKRSEPEVVSSSLPAEDGGKAGKVAFPVLVGEVSNLYKTLKTLPRAPITIDLHGNTSDEALRRLDEGLSIWVDTAMKGEYPWVIPVDIVCGGGSQVLSETVQGWIRSQRQVANRPKGYL